MEEDASCSDASEEDAIACALKHGAGWVDGVVRVDGAVRARGLDGPVRVDGAVHAHGLDGAARVDGAVRVRGLDGAVRARGLDGGVWVDALAPRRAASCKSGAGDRAGGKCNGWRNGVCFVRGSIVVLAGCLRP